MSTSAKKEVALSYAQSKCPLLFRYKTRGLGRGVPLGFLSCYPKEEEFLYPPMTCTPPPTARAACECARGAPTVAILLSEPRRAAPFVPRVCAQVLAA